VARPGAAVRGAGGVATATDGDRLADALLARCDFPPAGTEVTCAVSGGPDSLALLALAVRAGGVVAAVHVDHGLRPGSAAEADVVGAAAERFGAGFHAVRVDVPPGPDLEARARAARYAVLPAGALTGHTADDQAETVLLNLLRGAALDGLAGMDPGRRPLRRLRRHETQALCAALALDPVADPTNADPAFRRNRVRHELLPLLDAIAARDVVPVLARQADLARADTELLDELAAALDPTDARAVAVAPAALARRAVRAWLRAGGPGGAERHPPDGAAVERVLAVARGEAVACELAGGWRVARTAGRLRLEPPAGRRGLRLVAPGR
jgi:tRNA(Ile)-lysidine synthase